MLWLWLLHIISSVVSSQILKERVGMTRVAAPGLKTAALPTPSPSSPPVAGAPWYSILSRAVPEESQQLLLLTDWRAWTVYAILLSLLTQTNWQISGSSQIVLQYIIMERKKESLSYPYTHFNVMSVENYALKWEERPAITDFYPFLQYKH